MDRNQRQYEVNIQEANHVDSIKRVQERDEQMVKVKVLEAKVGIRKWKMRKQRRRKSRELGQCDGRQPLTNPQQRNGRSTN